MSQPTTYTDMLIAKLRADNKALLEAAKELVKLCKPMREEWLNEGAFVDACRAYDNIRAAIEHSEPTRATGQEGE